MIVGVVILILRFLFLCSMVASAQDDCGYGNITEICCNDYGCCWSTNDTAFAPIGCFNISEILDTTTTVMTTTTNMYTTTIAPTDIVTTIGITSVQSSTAKTASISSAAVTNLASSPTFPASQGTARTDVTASVISLTASGATTGVMTTTAPASAATALPTTVASAATGVTKVTAEQTKANNNNNNNNNNTITDKTSSAGGSVVLTTDISTTATTPRRKLVTTSSSYKSTTYYYNSTNKNNNNGANNNNNNSNNQQFISDYTTRTKQFTDLLNSTSTNKTSNNDAWRRTISHSASNGTVITSTSMKIKATTAPQDGLTYSDSESKNTTGTTAGKSRTTNTTTGQPRYVNKNSTVPGTPLNVSKSSDGTPTTTQREWNYPTQSISDTSQNETKASQKPNQSFWTTKPQDEIIITSFGDDDYNGSMGSNSSSFVTSATSADYFTTSFSTKRILRDWTDVDQNKIPTTKGNTGTVGPVDSYNDPDFQCFDKHIRKSQSTAIIFLTGSYTPQQCFTQCNASFSCQAFQASRSGSGVCGYFETQQDSSEFHDSTTTSIYTFSNLCVKTPLETSCITSKWYNTTYRCTSGLIATEHIQNEEECKAYCACGLQNCMAAVVRNNSGSFECYVVMDGSDMSNFQLCNVAVKQYIINDNVNNTSSAGVTKAPSIPSRDSTYYNTTCWNPPIVNNANHYLYKDQYGIAVVYICMQGYLFPSGERVRTLVCSRLAWGYIQPMCLPTKCSYPPLTYEPFEVIERSCPGQSGSLDTTPPYFRAGLKVESSKCTVKKLVPILVPEPSYCNFTCQSPLLIYNTTAIFDPFNKTVNYNCFKGHRFADGRNKRTVMCFDNGTWPETEPCSALFCDDIAKLRKVVLDTGNTIFGTIVTVTCEKGYMFPKNFNRKVIECKEALEQDRITAVWNDTVEACTDVICTNPYTNDTSRTTSSDPGILNKSVYSYLEAIEYVCKDYNLKFDDGNKKRSLTCSDNGLWNFDNVHCGANRCDPIPYIFEAQASSILALRGTNVTFTCHNGFWFEPGVMTMNIVCDGVAWSQPKYSKCEVVMCPVDTDSTSQWNTTGDLIQYGISINVDCNPGHYLFDTPTRESSRIVSCTKYGNWSDNVHCMPVNCGPVVGVNRASVEEDNPTTTYNSTIHYTCLPGHWFGRDGYQLIARCNEEGLWSDNDGVTDTKKWRSCVEITCLPLLTYSTSNLTTSVGSSGNVTCPPDRKFKNIQDLYIKTVCNSRGEWIPELPECIATQNIANFTVAEAPKAGVIAGVALAIVIIEITCFILLDLPAIKTSIQYLIGNLSRCKNKCMK